MKNRIAALAGALTIVVLVGCSKRESSGGDVDSTHTNIDVGVGTDTINVPTLGIEKDTIVVSKPVMGRKAVTIQHPTVTVQKKP